MTRKTKYYNGLKREGKCVGCRQERGDNGTETLCRLCAKKLLERQKKRREQLKAQGMCIQCGQRKTVNKNHCEECRIKGLRSKIISQAKRRAKKKSLPFDLTQKDIDWVKVCPVLGIPLVHNSKTAGEDSLTLDRLIPELGYVKGNVHIISMKANQIKLNATAKEVRKVADWMERRRK